MSQVNAKKIQIKNAHANNLKGISLDIPHHQFVVVTGISGSGKSSLAFDIIAKEGQRRYFETLPSFARQYQGKIKPAEVDSIEGLSPVIMVGQKTTSANARSTVGTMTDLYDWLRLLYARTGNTSDNTPLTRSHFSFNADKGKCLRCNGLGEEEEIDLKKLITHPEKTLKEGALAPTLPTGYIMYSQVTMEVLNQVCNAEGFNVEIPWNKLTPPQQKVILFGSEKIKVPFGKHSIESRLKWTGIKAKPREDGFYKGMVPIMSDILRRDRNPNILKYVSAVTCSSCNGKRLNQTALNVWIHDQTIADLLQFSFTELQNWIKKQKWSEIARPIIEKIEEQLIRLNLIGLDYLTLDQSAKSLSASEAQRIRVVNQLGTKLSNVLYVFDEPSIGLSTAENKTMIRLLKSLVKKGNSVIIVEHDLDTIQAADWVIEIGPKAGINGGELLFNGTFLDFKNQPSDMPSFTLKALHNHALKVKNKTSNQSFERIKLLGCSEGKLNGSDYEFLLGGLTIVTGRSGSGKANLVNDTLKKLVSNHLLKEKKGVKVSQTENIEKIDRLIFANQSPIGRTPRSNPATYLGLADHFRDLLAKQTEAKEKKYTKSHFSFNTKGGRCETCQGAGKTQIGMHFLGNVDLICETCNGKRFKEETLKITYKGLSIADIYQLTINQALNIFKEEKKIQKGLEILVKIGLGYLKLGQSSTTLSGGEAQRIKLANELQKNTTGHTLYILDEPSIGLHPYDIQNLIKLFHEIKANNGTIVCIEQDELLLNEANHIIKFEENSLFYPTKSFENKTFDNTTITLKGVTTHQLKNIQVSFPQQQLSVITGLSGSGKSSLAYNTLFAEANNQFSESLSTFSRSFIKAQNTAKIAEMSGLSPAIAFERKKGGNALRSTVGTVTGLYDHLRLLFSRISQLNGKKHTAQHFSFNHKLGACTQCSGIGFEKKCDPLLLISHPEKPLLEGALTENKGAKYFTNLQGQFIATLKEIANKHNWNLDLPWKKLPKNVQETILYGTGEVIWKFEWEFKTKTRAGIQQIETTWLGFLNYINSEYELRKHNKKASDLMELLAEVACDKCNESRLKSELLDIYFQGKNIAEISKLSITECLSFILENEQLNDKTIKAICTVVFPPVKKLLKLIQELGLGYLSIDRPTNTLSGGELQRIHLSGQLSANLYGVTYVLDEPTIGLDPQQIDTLKEIVKTLISKGNTVIVIEHDKRFISAADYLIELGPGSGKNGGNVVFQGKIKELSKHNLTYQLLNNEVQITPEKNNFNTNLFTIKNATKHNLKGIDVSFKSNSINAVTGVSGSGKSTLVKEVLYASFRKKRQIGCDTLQGFEQFNDILLIDQQPISIHAIQSPATYTEILGQLQILFSKSEAAKKIKLKRADFSYQTKGGKCPTCNGYGEIKTQMDFMSDSWVLCEDCKGLRYNQVIQNCKIKPNTAINKHYSIAEILQLTITELNGLFDEKKLNDQLATLVAIGLGHLQLGQAGNTLSGGEAQRLKLAKAIFKNTGINLYLFDEPSTGLHQQDLIKLIAIFNQLIKKRHTIVFIEHNATLISAAHHQVRLGPGSGEKGGHLI